MATVLQLLSQVTSKKPKSDTKVMCSTVFKRNLLAQQVYLQVYHKHKTVQQRRDMVQ